MSTRPSPPRYRSRPAPRGTRVHQHRRVHRIPQQKKLYTAEDHSSPKVVDPGYFIPLGHSLGWGPLAEPFLRINEPAFRALDLQPVLAADRTGPVIRLAPGGRSGAIPLRSPQTGAVAGGFVVRPRFGWPGVGQVLAETGWHAAPEFLEFPLVPGSGREIPPWVLAGPVVTRLAAALRSLRPGYRELETVSSQPRGRTLWHRYVRESLCRGQWHRLPCRFPDLDTDPHLRRIIRWALERLHRDLTAAGGTDALALALADRIVRLLERLADVAAQIPRREELARLIGGSRFTDEALRRGIEAVGWIREERGLGGGREMDGLSWQLPLEQLWESYVESWVRRAVARTGGDVRVGRRGETVFPLRWSDPMQRSLGHLVPDVVVQRGRSLHIYDAKYKAHLAELDQVGWQRLADEARELHRADVHQILAYASLYEADDITATLVYPLRYRTWEALSQRRRDVSRAELTHRGRRLTLQLQGLPFGSLRRMSLD